MADHYITGLAYEDEKKHPEHTISKIGASESIFYILFLFCDNYF